MLRHTIASTDVQAVRHTHLGVQQLKVLMNNLMVLTIYNWKKYEWYSSFWNTNVTTIKVMEIKH